MGSGVSVAAEIDPHEVKIANRKVVVVAAGEPSANGIYSIMMNAKTQQPLIRNNSWVFKNGKGFQISREIVNDESGWIIGKPPMAYYGTRNESLICPSCVFKGGGDFVGVAPFPSVFDDLDREFPSEELPSLPKKVKSRIIPPPKLDSFFDEDMQSDDDDSFFAVSPVKQRNQAWRTPKNEPSHKRRPFGDLSNKENVENRYKTRKSNRYEYYRERLKRGARKGSSLREKKNIILKPDQRADPSEFI